MTRAAIPLLVVAVAVLAVRDRRHERQIARLIVDQQAVRAQLDAELSTDHIAKSLTGDPPRRQIPRYPIALQLDVGDIPWPNDPVDATVHDRYVKGMMCNHFRAEGRYWPSCEDAASESK